MISSLILTLSCCLSFATVSLTNTQHDFLVSNYDAQQIIEGNNLNNSIQIEKHVSNYINTFNSKKQKNINSESSQEIKESFKKLIARICIVFPTYVDSLNITESFYKDSQFLVLNKAKDLASSKMSTELKNYISKNYFDLNSLITSQIEAIINLLMN